MAEQALLDRLKRYSKKCLTERTDGDFADAVWEAVEVIDGLLNDLQEALDTIEQKNNVAEVRHGKWLWELADNGWANHICSECGYTKNTDIHVVIDYEYCPHCGARMDGE